MARTTIYTPFTFEFSERITGHYVYRRMDRGWEALTCVRDTENKHDKYVIKVIENTLVLEMYHEHFQKA